MTETPKIDDGGAAFPHTRVHADTSGCINDGMSLRDYFAARAMTALLGNPESHNADHRPMLMRCATDAYALADAMLAARSNPQGEQE